MHRQTWKEANVTASGQGKHQRAQKARHKRQGVCGGMRGTDLAPPLWLKLVRFIPVGRHILHSMHRNPQQHSFRHKQLAAAKPHVLLQIPACCPRTHHRKQPHAFLHVAPFSVSAAAAAAADTRSQASSVSAALC